MWTAVRKRLPLAAKRLLTWWFWKAILLLVFASFGVFVFVTTPDTLGVVREPGKGPLPEWTAKAPTLALLSAGMLFTTLFPKKDSRPDDITHFLGEVLAALCVLGASYYWLQADTTGKPGPLLGPTVAGMTALGIVVILARGISYVWTRRQHTPSG